MIDITQAIQVNNNRLELSPININYHNHGMLLSGGVQITIYGHKHVFEYHAVLVADSIAGRKAFELKGLTDIKDGGFGLPQSVVLIFDQDGFVVDIEAEPTQYSKDQYCSICKCISCECTTGEGITVETRDSKGYRVEHYPPGNKE